MAVSAARHAVDHVTEGEGDAPPVSPNNKSGKDKIIDWQEFWHLFISWGASGLIIFVVLLILTMADRSTEGLSCHTNLWNDIIIRIDTISLVFSLVLSAGLEQVWNNKRQWKYKFTQIGDLALAIIGLILYLTYSLWAIYDPYNPYYTGRLWVNICYIIFSVIFVVFGFIMRALVEQEEK